MERVEWLRSHCSSGTKAIRPWEASLSLALMWVYPGSDGASPYRAEQKRTEFELEFDFQTIAGQERDSFPLECRCVGYQSIDRVPESNSNSNSRSDSVFAFALPQSD